MESRERRQLVRWAATDGGGWELRGREWAARGSRERQAKELGRLLRACADEQATWTTLSLRERQTASTRRSSRVQPSSSHS